MTNQTAADPAAPASAAPADAESLLAALDPE